MAKKNEFKICPHCGKTVLAHSSVCKYCYKNIPKDVEPIKEANYSQYKDPYEFIGKICFFILVFAFIFSLCGDVKYKLTHLFPKVSETLSAEVDPFAEDDQQPVHMEQITVKANNTFVMLMPQAKYSLSGIVVAKNMNFWLRGMQNDFDKVVPLDLGIAWGKLADVSMLRKWKIKSHKTLGQARQLSYQYKYKDIGDLSSSYINSHISHNHVIPANDNVAAALLNIKKWDKVKLDGYLVDIVYSNGRSSYTSLERNDTNPTSRGAHANGGSGGACEIFYVTSVQIKNKYYK